MTYNTQVGLKRWCEAFIDGDISAGQFKRAIRIWHNKQMSELLDRLAIEVRASDYVVVTPKKQFASTPKNGGLRYWEFLDSLWDNLMNRSRQRVVDEEEV